MLMINAPHRAVFHATFTELVKLKACFHEEGAFNATFGTFNTRIPDPYTGEYVITPKAWEEQVLETKHKTMLDDVTVLRVPYYETHNTTNGLTAYIASEV